MIDFKLDGEGDILITDGKFTLLNTIQEAVRQRILITLRTFLGEYFLDISQGIPYRQQIFNKGITTKETDAIFLAKILSDPDVIKVESFSSTYLASNRSYDLRFEVLTTDGLLRINLPNITPNDEVEYLPASDFVISPSCRTQGIMSGGEGAIIETNTV